MTISQFTNELLDKVLNELKKKDNMNKIEQNLNVLLLSNNNY